MRVCKQKIEMNIDYFRTFKAFFRTALCRTFHNLICNKFVILKNKKLTKILEVGKFSLYVTSLSKLFRK